MEIDDLVESIPASQILAAGSAPAATNGETRSAADRIAQQSPEEDTTLVQHDFDQGSDIELAHAMLTDMIGPGGEKLISTEGKMYKYYIEIGLWKPIPRPVLEKAIHRFDGQKPKTRKRILLTQSRIRGSVDCAFASTYEVDAFSSAPTQGIAYKNVFLKISPTGVEALPHSPIHRARVGLEFNFTPEAKSPRFLQALEEVFQYDEDKSEKIALIQEFAGACLAGIATKYQKALILIGDGANGKSVIILVLSRLFSPGALTSIAPQAFGSEYKRAMLAGAHLNVVPEMSDSDIRDVGAFKSIIAGDSIDARLPYGQPFMFRPIAGHVFCGNKLPGTKDQSHGFWRRMLPIQFNRIFKESEQDKELVEKIVATELPGVAAWAIKGLQRLLATGRYTTPESAADVRQEWMLNADTVTLFLDDGLIVTPEPSTQAKVLYRMYRAWAKENGHDFVASNVFGERMRKLGHTPKKTNRGAMYYLRHGELRDEGCRTRNDSSSPPSADNDEEFPAW